MSDDKKAVFATAAVCILICLLVYGNLFYHDAFMEGIWVVVGFLCFGTLALICIAFALLTVASIVLSAWFALEWCCRKVWGLFRRWRDRQ